MGDTPCVPQSICVVFRHSWKSGTEPWQRLRLSAAALTGFLGEAQLKAAAIYREVLECDLHSVGQAYLPKDMTSQTVLAGKNLLQVSKVRDVTLPLKKSKDDAEGDDGDEYRVSARPNAHRLLRLEATDGHRTVVLVELTPMPSLRSVPIPGTKIIATDMPVREGFGLMSERTFQVAGGGVESLARDYALLQGEAERPEGGRAAPGEGPPPFVPFQKNKAPPAVAAAPCGTMAPSRSFTRLTNSNVGEGREGMGCNPLQKDFRVCKVEGASLRQCVGAEL